MAIVISEKMYMSFQERGINEDTTLLGFATYLEDNKAFEKRKSTVDSWGETSVTHYLKEDDPRWDPDVGGRWQTVTIARPDLASKIVDNPLLPGFKIAKEVRRHGWGSGNVVWRIEDPRGFELEISSANMASIMDCCTIYRGTIDTPCRWGWNKQNGSRVVLLPEGTDPYKEAVADNELHNTKPLKIGDIDIGDVVKLKNGNVGTYMGGHFYVEAHDCPSDEHIERNYVDRYRWQTSKKKTHFFLEEGNKIFVMASPKVANITQKAETVLSAQEAADEINALLRLESRVSSFNNVNPIAVSPEKIKDEEIGMRLVLISYDDATFIDKEDRYGDVELDYKRFPILFEHNGKMYRNNGPQWTHRDDEPKTKCNRVFTESFTNNTYRIAGKMHSSGWRYSKTNHYMIEDHIDILEKIVKGCPMSILTIQYGGRLYSPRIY